MFLDNASTTPLNQQIKEYIISILDSYGNPSSGHSIGLNSKYILENARNNVAEFINLNLNESEIIFTSSGSASNTLAIKGLDCIENVFLYSPIAHKSMLLACQSCKNSRPLKVDEYGVIDLEYLEDKLYNCEGKTPIVCIDIANSEIGTIQDIEAIVKIVHSYKGVIIADATGYIPYFKVNYTDLGVDILTFSGHKLHALKGVGVACKPISLELKPLVFGSQESGLFGGTENIVGIASLGKAVEIYDYSFVNYWKRDYILDRIQGEITYCQLLGSKENRLPLNLYLYISGIQGEDLMTLMDLDGYQISTGSACNNGSKVPSPILSAIGLDKCYMNSCIRITLSGYENFEELNNICNTLKKNIEILRVMK